MSRYFTKRRSGFICLFINTVRFILPPFYQLMHPKKDILNFKLVNLNEYFDFIISDLYVSKYSLSLGVVQLGEPYQYRLIKMILIHFKRFLKFNYDEFSHKMFLVHTGVNSLKERLAQKQYSNFLGFKIKCVGRFTRKQRVSSY